MRSASASASCGQRTRVASKVPQTASMSSWDSPKSRAARMMAMYRRTEFSTWRGYPPGPVRLTRELVDQPQQVERGERLGEEQGRPGVVRRALVLDSGGQHHDPRAAQVVALAQRAAGVEAVELGHVDVEEDDPRLGLVGLDEALLAGGGLDELEARDVLERRRDQPPDEGVVVDDQDGRRHWTSSRMRSIAPSSTVPNASTTCGSNCVPASEPMTSRARSSFEAGRYGRSGVSASSVSATANTRAASGIASSWSPSG